MFDHDTENGQPRHNPIPEDDARELVAQIMNVPADLIKGFMVITVHDCDQDCNPPHLFLNTNDLTNDQVIYVLQQSIAGAWNQWRSDDTF